MWEFIKKHYKTAGAIACGVAASSLGDAFGDQAQGAAIAVCSVLGLTAAKEYGWGKQVGNLVRAVLPKKPPAK
jgi:hypothetical protein